MKSVLITVTALTTVLLLSSCSDDTAGSHAEEAAPAHAHEHGAGDTGAQATAPESHDVADNEVPASEAADEAADDGLGLTLNDGTKWEMDEHTRGVFATMATSFLAADHRALDEAALKTAGSGLQANINELIQGCTMDGSAHDQLHVYLMGYMPAVAALEEGGQMADADKVALYLEAYDEYFE